MITCDLPPPPFFQGPARALESYINLHIRKTVLYFESYNNNILSRNQQFLRLFSKLRYKINPKT